MRAKIFIVVAIAAANLRAAEYRSWVSGVVHLTGPTRILSSRVVLNDCTIVTHGYDLEITAYDEIHTFGHPRIVAFSEEERRAGLGHHGKPAGVIIIRAPKIHGSQIVILNTGQDGGVGVSGHPGARGIDGTSGRPGITGKVVLIRSQCILPATNGESGGPGGIGQGGGAGGDGGAGGKVLLELLSDFDKILVDTAGGKGGMGGAGGPGGLGGEGGAGGAATGECPPGKPGGRGAQGPPGERGSTGKDGVDGEVRLARPS